MRPVAPGFRRREVDADDLDGLGEPRVHRAGAHQAHANAVALEIEPKHLRDPAQPELARAVRRVPRQTEETRGRGHVHQVPALAGADHLRDEALDDVDRTHQVHVHDSLPVVMLESFDRAPDRDPRDVHHYVHAAGAGVDRAGELPHGFEVGDVERSMRDSPCRRRRGFPRRLASSNSAFTSVRYRSAPAAAAASAVARPMPLAAPVMTHFLWRKVSMCLR